MVVSRALGRQLGMPSQSFTVILPLWRVFSVLWELDHVHTYLWVFRGCSEARGCNILCYTVWDLADWAQILTQIWSVLHTEWKLIWGQWQNLEYLRPGCRMKYLVGGLVLNIFYLRTQMGFHVKPDPDIRRSTCCPLQLWTRENSPIDNQLSASPLARR